MTAIGAISSAPTATRMRWWAELNSWKIPLDLPVSIDAGEGDLRNSESFDAAFRAASDGLTEAEASLGWWVFSLGKTQEEWRDWWVTDRRRSEAQADDAIAELAKAAP